MTSRIIVGLAIFSIIFLVGFVFWIYPAYQRYLEATEKLEIAKKEYAESVREFNKEMSEARQAVHSLPPYN